MRTRFTTVTDVKGLQKVVVLQLTSTVGSKTLWVLCDRAYWHTWLTGKLANKLQLQDRPVQKKLNGVNSTETVDTELVEVKMPNNYGEKEQLWCLEPNLKKSINVGTNSNGVPARQIKYSHLMPPMNSGTYKCSNVESVLQQEALKGWVYDVEPSGSYKQINPRSASAKTTLKILRWKTYHCGVLYQVGMLWAIDDSHLDIFCAWLHQQGSFGKRLKQNPISTMR